MHPLYADVETIMNDVELDIESVSIRHGHQDTGAEQFLGISGWGDVAAVKTI